MTGYVLAKVAGIAAAWSLVAIGVHVTRITWLDGDREGGALTGFATGMLAVAVSFFTCLAWAA